MTRLGPSQVELDILCNKINQLIPKPDLETDNNIPYILIILGILLVFNFLRRPRVQIITFWVDYSVPENNLHAREVLELSWLNVNYIAHFRIIQHPAILIAEFNMPYGKNELKLFLDNLYRTITESDDILDRSYETFEAYLARAGNWVGETEEILIRHLTSNHALIYTISETNVKKMCLVRKLESLYLHHDPTYIRKPFIESEGHRIRGSQTPVIRH